MPRKIYKDWFINFKLTWLFFRLSIFKKNKDKAFLLFNYNFGVIKAIDRFFAVVFIWTLSLPGYVKEGANFKPLFYIEKEIKFLSDLLKYNFFKKKKYDYSFKAKLAKFAYRHL